MLELEQQTNNKNLLFYLSSLQPLLYFSQVLIRIQSKKIA
jgi:hypothetical protein